MVKIKDKPMVSVIIPTHNRANLIGKAIQSVLDQTHRDFELIVVDDGSTDNTEAVVKGFGDERIRYIRLDKNSGTSAVPRNTGIKAAEGEYIAGHDDDDIWLPRKLEKQVKAFEEAPPKVGVVYTGFRRIEGNREIYYPSSKVTQKEGNVHRELLKGTFVGNPNVLIKKECFDMVGMFDEELPFCLDWDMWLRISKYYDFKLIDEPLVISYYTPISMTSNRSAINRGWILFLEKHFQEFRENDKRLLAKHYFDFGSALCADDDISHFDDGRRSLQKAVRLQPLNLQYILFCLISLFGSALFHNRLLRKLNRKFRKLLERI